MSPKSTLRLEKVLTLLLAASFALPLLLTGGLSMPPARTFAASWLRNSTLGGVQTPPPEVALARSTLLSAKYQQAVAQHYDTHFAGRELMIRLIDELYLRVFRRTFTDLLVGPKLSLILRSYAEEYCLKRGGPERLLPLVEDLRRLQDFCDARGIAFALVITPSKAAIYPEQLPASWRRRYRAAPRYYDLLLPLLQARHIRYVDGHRIAADLKPTAIVPVFPLGGGHWSEPTGLATANALLALLASEGLNVQPITDYQVQVSDEPKGRDYDKANLANLASRLRYPVAAVTVQPLPLRNTYHPNVVFVGGSFTEDFVGAFGRSRQFSELEWYYYYNIYKYCSLDGEPHMFAIHPPPPHFETDVFAADALVLEANEETLPDEAGHLKAFLHDALNVLSDPHSPKPPFRYEVRTHYRWGDTLSLAAGPHPLNTAALSGFSGLAPYGAYTLGPVATIRLQAPPPEQDMVLAVEAGAFLVDTRLPEQRVGVYVNGRAVGEWVWTTSPLSHRELLIPREYLNGGTVQLEFHVARPGSPAEFGAGPDPAKYGIYVFSVRLHPAGQ